MEHFERNKLLMKLMLVMMRDRKAKQGQVRSVGYIREYGEMPDELGVYSLGQLNDEQLLDLAGQLSVKLQPLANGKSDIYMNDMGYKLVCPTAIEVYGSSISRQGLVDLAVQLQADSQAIEAVMNWMEQHSLQNPHNSQNSYNYLKSDAFTESHIPEEQEASEEWQLKSKPQGKEAQLEIQHLSQDTTPDRSWLIQEVLSRVTTQESKQAYSKAWQTILAHLWCTGACEQPSKFPADLILSYGDALNMNTWDIYNPGVYMERVWSSVQISLDTTNLVTIQGCAKV